MEFMQPQDENEMNESFGDFIRRHREASGKTLDAISRTTRISKRYLQAFEDNDVVNIPETAFARGFLRSYANEVGLDAEDCLVRYERFRRSLIPTQIREFKRPPKYMILGEGAEPSVQRWLVWGVCAGIVIAGLIVGVLWGIRNFQLHFKTPQEIGMKENVLKTEDSETNEANVGHETMAPTTTREPAPTSAPSAPAEAAAPRPANSPPAAVMETPVRPSILTITAIKDGKLTVRLDENALQEIAFKAGGKSFFQRFSRSRNPKY